MTLLNPRVDLAFKKFFSVEENKFTHSTDESINLMLPRIKNSLDRWSAFLTKPSNLNSKNLPKELRDPCIEKALDVLKNIYLNEGVA